MSLANIKIDVITDAITNANKDANVNHFSQEEQTFNS